MHLHSAGAICAVKCLLEETTLRSHRKSTLKKRTSDGKKDISIFISNEDTVSADQDGPDGLETATTTAMTSIMSSSSANEDGGQQLQPKTDFGESPSKRGSWWCNDGEEDADEQTVASEQASPQAESCDPNTAGSVVQSPRDAAWAENSGEDDAVEESDIDNFGRQTSNESGKE